MTQNEVFRYEEGPKNEAKEVGFIEIMALKDFAKNRDRTQFITTLGEIGVSPYQGEVSFVVRVGERVERYIIDTDAETFSIRKADEAAA